MILRTNSLVWQTYQSFRHQLANETIKDWLLHDGSLTQKLKKNCQTFKVQIVSTRWQKPTRSEAKLLKIPFSQITYIREVKLICDNQIGVIARTVIPIKTLTGREKILLRLGTKPLGEYIFKQRHLQRSEFQIAKILLSPDKENWARRSIFLLKNKPLLVTEIFTNIISHK